MNIIWLQPSGAIAVTSVFDYSDPHELAERLKVRGDVPSDWNAVTFGYEGPWPSVPQEFWKWENDVVTVNADLLKSFVWEQIKAVRDQRKAGGVKVKVGGVDKWFHSDDASRIQQMGLVMMGANIPANLQWKTLDGSFVTMTQAVAQSVFTAAAASDQAIFAVAEAHRTPLAACEDPAVYDYSTGWPAIFGE